MKTATDFWGSMTEMWQSTLATQQKSTSSQKNAKARPQELWDASFNIWQTMVSAYSTPETMDAAARGMHALPEIVLRMAKTGWEGYFHLQQQWLEKAGTIGSRTEAYKFEDLDRDTFRAWLEIYQKDFGQFLNIPQLGLTRSYQERINRAVDKFNLFQVEAAEFLYLFYLPLEKSLRVMGENFQELSQEGNLSDNFKDYYNMWIKILEGHYMTLFKSPEYTLALSKAINSAEDFIDARQELLADGLKALHIPTDKDMDELYKELYLLKKKVKALEKKVDNR
ncbi:MAG: hypothetical protein JSV14_07725 [Deltaproteobacteria bacterium]|nr:MAG: hypothetical protein JSV14_07725 [Deltaproteobacteria bacterium]